MKIIKLILKCLSLSIFISSSLFAQDSQIYGETDFQASGSSEAHIKFTQGLLQLHNFEYDDARKSFLSAQEIDSDFAMAYWGEALTYEHPLWSRHNLKGSRDALAKLGNSSQDRLNKAITEREKHYIDSVNILFGEGNQEEREIKYSLKLKQIYESYPDDLDAAAFYALSLITISHEGRDYSLYMRAGAITEDILLINPRHPGALHYAIHSYDDPIHAPLGLRAAKTYVEVAPSAVHALHMGSHIYFALGMWELGTERNTRSFEQAISRRQSPDEPYGGQAYHALTWLIYSLNQEGKHNQASERLSLIEKQVSLHNGVADRQNFIAGRASHLIDTQDWFGHYAKIEINYEGLSPYFIATDQYIHGIISLKNKDVAGALLALKNIGGSDPIETRSRVTMAPRLMHLSLEGQIEFAKGNVDRAVNLIKQAVELELSAPPDYGPPVPVQPTAELLANIYLIIGDKLLAKENFQLSLKNTFGRLISENGLKKSME
ncbi:MAG: hypothetical protein CBC38_06800 [Gammaproteobacteria bacterium TMED78]|nr:MAG: hypothetical protein CBC38_06800 [Gammaproteobacteria bacterium TMED78]|tara:strand:+ start:6636 stop:8108 length:1473 start_codon:yes stop_codon:yes gene_type:complete